MPRSRADVPRARLDELESGQAESRDLVEGLAMDLGKLAACLVPGAVLPAGTYVQRMRAGGELLRAQTSRRLGTFSRHRSDTVRAWACFAQCSGIAVESALTAVRPYADDAHFGVREWAWMAVREAVAADPDRAIALLTPWTAEASANLRRFASEVTRPRGVWCAHIHLLRDEPQRGLPILAPLRADPEKYVQDSVANWLNDAAKTRPDWVRATLAAWPDAAPRIRTRGARSLPATRRR